MKWLTLLLLACSGGTATHEAASADTPPHEPSSHEVAPRDAAPHDAAPPDDAPHDVAPHGASPPVAPVDPHGAPAAPPPVLPDAHGAPAAQPSLPHGPPVAQPGPAHDPAPAHPPPAAPVPDPAPVEAPADAPPAAVADPAHPVGALRGAFLRIAFGFGLLVALGVVSSSVIRRRPHLAPEVANVRFVLTLFFLGWAAFSAIAAAQVGGTVVSLGGLATAVVISTGFSLWWLPRYLDGLWLILAASREEQPWIECGDVSGALAEVGPLRARLVGADGHWTSVPIASFGGAVVRGAHAASVRLEVPVGVNGELARVRATISPFRDPSEPVRWDRQNGVLSMRCWSERAAGYLERELLALDR